MLTKEEAVSLLGGSKKELPDSPQTPEEILEEMKIAASNYYREAIATNCHTFIEFTGLINEYIKICERNLKQRGVDFTKTSTHCPGEQKLQIKDWELQYINDKLRCIFPNLQLVEIEDGETNIFQGSLKVERASSSDNDDSVSTTKCFTEDFPLESFTDYG